jgi:serine/threonine protein kinase, bacterial
VDGTDLAHQMAQRYPAGMPTTLVVPIITAVASALDYAHKKSLLHQDVKPANIIVADLVTDNPSVFLADFGIARPLDDTSGITTTNMTVGTVAYAAPEQLMGEVIDGRADEYALAATSYHLLTGTQPFPHTNPAVVISRHLNTTPPKLGDSRSDLAGLDVALQTALAKDPDDRYLTCTAFAQSLQGGSHGQKAVSPSALTLAAPRRNQLPIQSPSGSAGEDSPQKKSVTGSRSWIVGITAAATVLLIGIGALAGRALTGSDPVATETTSAITQSTVTLTPPLSTSTVSSDSVTSPSSTSS